MLMVYVCVFTLYRSGHWAAPHTSHFVCPRWITSRAPSLPSAVGTLMPISPTARTLRHASSAPIGSSAARAARGSSLRHERRDVGRELGLHGGDGVGLRGREDLNVRRAGRPPARLGQRLELLARLLEERSQPLLLALLRGLGLRLRRLGHVRHRLRPPAR